MKRKTKQKEEEGRAGDDKKNRRNYNGICFLAFRKRR